MGVFVMILLRKKRIILITLSVFVSILTFALIKDKREIVPTVSLPVSGKTIVIDARTWKTRWGCTE